MISKPQFGNRIPHVDNPNPVPKKEPVRPKTPEPIEYNDKKYTNFDELIELLDAKQSSTNY